ncbi:MBL fold metallo-hydrolase [Lacticaseibacillus manihotivorans]|uniref:Metallo-beta-lactamase superfamily hydrolase n=2 Tax=Lacticaseibacillus manihotivorans TaxID=88233 RepID=A0A0R1QBV9_9LACO|nr:MBL fold metallo-hydrolase [Lacticaseibacillus manihotivorans]KRL41937.1 metallo-beta-lactamase superfamily hydrolase [Lacticaseibacillus manihotivorans DSM 13343 = JCM 12514]QFQ92177.1 MBL fold metallo-hydrolase [Lacticaseibacillus manihotivorans]
MTSVRFLNGLHTIGGNIVEISTQTSRIITDFGVAADLTGETIDESIASGKLPNLPEFFHNTPDQYKHEAIVISHLHIDHMGALQYLTKDVPIYMSQDSLKLYETLIAAGDEQPVANLHALKPEHPLAVGDLTVTGYLSDHDEPGIMALAISDGDHLYVHSGDVRLNGPHRDRVDHWAQTLHDQHVKMLFLEGTTFSFDSDTPVEDSQHPATPYTEATLQTAFGQALDAADQLVVLNPYVRNWERLANFQATAHAHHRQIAWTELSQQVLNHVAHIQPDHVNAKDLKAHPEKYVLENSFENLNDLTDLTVSVYLHSNGVPLGDYDPHFQELLDYLNQHNIPIQYLSCTGHATKTDLITLCQMIAPEIVVPWHSFKPELEAKALDKQTLAMVLQPEKDLFYSVDDPEDAQD